MSTTHCKLTDVKDDKYGLDFETSLNGFKFVVLGNGKLIKLWFDEDGWKKLKTAVDTQFEIRK